MDNPTVYSDIISPRSRRLRTVGIVLLAAACLMAIYGYFGLMPSLERSLRTHTLGAYPYHRGAIISVGTPTQFYAGRAERARKLQVAVAMAYWGACLLLITGVFFVAWLDFREVSLRYVEQRRAMWGQAADRIADPDDPA